MKKKYVLNTGWLALLLFASFGLFIACTNEEDDTEACQCTFYPEINQYLPNPLTADDVIGEDTYVSGKELRSLNERCLEFCK